jgi:predicted lipase
MVALRRPTQSIVVSFRGSSNFVNILVDMHLNMVPLWEPNLVLDKVADSVLVHEGFRNCFYNIQDSLSKDIVYLLQLYPQFEVVYTGHSLGAAMATIAAVVSLGPGGFLQPYINPNQTRLYTFGEPRVGNAAFARYSGNMGFKESFRVVNGSDIVPQIVRVLETLCSIIVSFDIDS